MGGLRERVPALLALSIPVFAGLDFARASQPYLAMNAGAIVAALGMAVGHKAEARGPKEDKPAAG